MQLNKSLSQNTEIFLGKKPQQTLAAMFVAVIVMMLSFQILGAFFKFDLTAQGYSVPYFGLMTAFSVGISSVAFYALIRYALRLSTTISNPKKTALDLSVFFGLIILAIDLSKAITFTIPEDAVVRLLLLVSLYLFAIFYLLFGLLMERLNA